MSFSQKQETDLDRAAPDFIVLVFQSAKRDYNFELYWQIPRSGNTVSLPYATPLALAQSLWGHVSRLHNEAKGHPIPTITLYRGLERLANPKGRRSLAPDDFQIIRNFLEERWRELIRQLEKRRRKKK